jgi:DNA polymerase III epsilon subunit-like protein
LIENHTLRSDRLPEIIEFGAASVEWERIESAPADFSVLIRPKRGWIGDIKKRPPITDDVLKDYDHFERHAAAIKSLLETSDIVVGHNLSFDMEMVDIEFERIGQRVSWPALRICTIEQSAHHFGRNIKLGDLYMEFFGIEHKEAHRAMPDVRATLNCLREMRRRAWL